MRDGQTARVVTTIHARISSRALVAGERLPSIRGLAATLGVSPSTVVEAYDRLAAEGLIRARRGSGFFVAAGASAHHAVEGQASAQPRAVDPLWVSRQSLDADPATLKPGCGWLPEDWMPVDALRRSLRSVARRNSTVLSNYAGTRGSSTLRRLLMARFAGHGLDVSPEHVLLTESGSQALDLVCRCLLRPGDTVLVDDPCYFNVQALLRVHQARIASVPVGHAGPEVAKFRAIVEAEQPRLYITNSSLHNPTGATLSAQCAHQLLTIARANGLTIVEDDIFADFLPEPCTQLAALDGLEQVIRIGSFSKSLSASIRCGYIAARPDLVDELVDLQVATRFGGPSPVAAGVIAGVLAGGGYRKHMDELHRRLARARREVASRLQAIGITPWLMPRGGFYLWCELPDGGDAAQVAQAAMEEGVVLAPGNVFSASGSATSLMRFNVAQCGDVRVAEVLARAITRAARGGGAER